MSQSDREKWDKRYREGAYAARKHPSALLVEWLPKLAIDASEPCAIDLACGIGRNTLYLAQQGWRVSAVDISGVALDKLAATATDDLDVHCTEMDLETRIGATETVLRAMSLTSGFARTVLLAGADKISVKCSRKASGLTFV